MSSYVLNMPAEQFNASCYRIIEALNKYEQRSEQYDQRSEQYHEQCTNLLYDKLYNKVLKISRSINVLTVFAVNISDNDEKVRRIELIRYLTKRSNDLCINSSLLNL